MTLTQILESYYREIFREELSESEVFEAHKNFTGFYGAIAEATCKSEKR